MEATHRCGREPFPRMKDFCATHTPLRSSPSGRKRGCFDPSKGQTRIGQAGAFTLKRIAADKRR